MQVNAVQATSRAFDADSETIAPQVSAVTSAAEGVTNGYHDVNVRLLWPQTLQKACQLIQGRGTSAAL